MDISKQTVIDSLRNKISEMSNLCTRAEIDDDMSTYEFLAHMADAMTQPSVRILATLYNAARHTQGEQLAEELIEGYVQHLRSSVKGTIEAAEEAMAAFEAANASDSTH